MTNINLRYAAACCTLMLMSFATAFGQADSARVEEDSLEFFDASEVVVSASRWEERYGTVSREITKIAARDITFKAPPTSADALSQTGLVHVQKSQLGGGSPMLRGYAANAVMIVIDGIRVNNAIYRGGNLQNVISLDASSLDGVEVLFGPGSVQYGSDALGGVMNFQTRRPVFASSEIALEDGSSESPMDYHGSLWTRYGSAMNEVSGSAAIDISTDVVASSTVLSVSTFGDLAGGRQFMSAYPDLGRRPWYVDPLGGNASDAGGSLDSVHVNPDDHVQVPTGYNQYNILENLAIKVSDKTTLKYTGIFTTSTNIPRYDRLVQERNGAPRFAEWNYGPQTWTLHALTLTTGPLGTIADNASIIGSFQFYEESRLDRRLNDPMLNSQTDAVLVGALNVDLQKRLSSFGQPEVDVYYGLEAYINDVASSGSIEDVTTGATTPGPTRYPDGGSFVSSAAAYAQLRYGISEKVTLSGGLRFTWYDLTSTISDTTIYPFAGSTSEIAVNTSALSGSIGAAWMATQSMVFHVNASSGFRAPNVDDIAKIFDSAPGLVVIPNASLTPEYAYTIEGGIELGHGSYVEVDASAYRTWSIDAIERRPTTLNGQDSILFGGEMSAVYTNVNIGRADIYGANISVKTRRLFDHLSMLATASWNDGRDVENDLPLRHIPPVFGTVQAYWEQWYLKAGVEFWWAAAKPFNELPPEEQAKVGINYTEDGTPAWQRIDASVILNAFHGFTLIARVENILDLNYHTFASAISSPGRNISLTGRYTW